MWVVVTRIGPDGAMGRRMADTCAAGWSDGPEWEDLARRALAVAPPCRPVPGCRIFQVRPDGGQVLVAEHDPERPLLDLVTAVLAAGQLRHLQRPD
jgi:hypothetical protein